MLKLTKKGDKYWLFEDSQIGLFSPSKFTINLELNQIVIVYENGLKSKRYNVSDCEIYDLGEMTPFITSSGDLFMQKLEELNCPCFQKNENIFNIYGGGSWGSITGDLSDQTDLQDALDDKLDKDSTAGVERAYIINADGSQGTKATSDFGGGGSNIITEINTLGTVNTSTTETITYSLLIPANTISVGVYDCIFRSIRSSGSGSSTLKLYLNSANTLVGASLVGQVPSTATARYMPLQRFVDVKVVDGTGLGTQVANVANNNAFLNDYVQHGSTTGMGNIAIDWTADVYLIATLTASVGTDVIRGTFLTFKK
jgi:hypothetical protein